MTAVRAANQNARLRRWLQARRAVCRCLPPVLLVAGAVPLYFAKTSRDLKRLIEVDPFGGTTGPSFLIGKLAGSDLLDHATQGVCCCCCRGGHVGDAAASSKRSVMSTALPARAPLTPSRHTAIGVRPASA